MVIRSKIFLKRRILPFFISGHNRSKNGNKQTNISISSVTLVTQISFDRISRIEEICHRWTGPLSVAVYLTDADLVPFIQLLKTEFPCVMKLSSEVQLHLVFRIGSMYPTNMLRNLAMKYVHTPYVFILDADFLPFEDFEPLLN